MISSKTKIYGVIGNPIEHSLSPVIHNMLFDYYKLDMIYLAFHISKDIEIAINGLLRSGIIGLNVTLPYKEIVCNSVYHKDNHVNILGASNTLKSDGDNFYAYNTDIYGINKTLEINNININDQNIVILGFGGAGTSVLYASINNYAKKIYIYVRNVDKTRSKVQSILYNMALYEDRDINYNEKEFDHYIYYSIVKNKRKIEIYIYTFDKLLIANYDSCIAIQTTSVGMNVGESIVSSTEFFDRCSCGIDIIYKPKRTQFLQELNKRNKVNINGLDMLIFQAVNSFEIWNDYIKVDMYIIDKIKSKLEEMLNRG